MKRRAFMAMGVVAGAAVVSGAAWRFTGPGPTHPDLTRIRRGLSELAKTPKSFVFDGDWTPSQVFVHLAQSVEFSITGFPEPKSAAFQSTAGAIAFRAFAARGEMFHGLTAPIDGAPALPTALPVEDALTRLLAAIDAFSNHTGGLEPHFAYGALSRDDYALAHAMHVDNHMTTLRNM